SRPADDLKIICTRTSIDFAIARACVRAHARWWRGKTNEIQRRVRSRLPPPAVSRANHQFLASVPYYAENRPDALGYVANPAGSSYVDGGVGNFITHGRVLSQPSAVDQRWLKLAPGYQGRFQVPTLR